MTKSELREAIPVAEADVNRLRQSTAKFRESYQSLRAQHQQLRQRHDQFEWSRADFIELELPAVASLVKSFGNASLPKVLKTFATSDGRFADVVKALQQARSKAQERLEFENADLVKLDFSDEVVALRSAISLQKEAITKIENVPMTAAIPVAEAMQFIDTALNQFPERHAGDLRVASQLYQRSNDLLNAAARLEAASEASLDSDRQVIAANTQLKPKPRQELISMVKQFQELSKTKLPAAIKKARAVGATDANTNYELAAKSLTAAAKLAPKDDANLLVLSQNLDQLGLQLREAGIEIIRGSRAMSVQIEGPAKVAYYSARAKADSIRRVENQAAQQRNLEARIIATTRRRGRTAPSEEEKQKLLKEAAAAGKRAADLSRQAERMLAINKGKVEQTKAALDKVSAAVRSGYEDGKQAQQLGDQFRKLADTFEQQVAEIKPRENSEAGRTARHLANEIKAVNDLAQKIEALALRIHPNLHKPSETEVASRQADETLEKAKALLAEEMELNKGLHPDALLTQISNAEKNDLTVRDELAAAEQRLLELRALDALPEPDPNPKRAQQAISSAADEQSRVISPIASAGESLIGAALHEQRLGHAANAKQLGLIAKRVHALAASEIPEKADQLRSTKRVQDSGVIANKIETSIQAELYALRLFLFPESNVSSRIIEADEEELSADLMSERESEVSEQLAQILFQIQQQVPKETLLAQLELSEQGTQASIEKDVELTESTPEAEVEKDENEEQNSQETQTSPETKPTQPETKPTQPENKPTQPESKPTQPENQPTQPESMPTQPENKPTQPESKPTQPENKPTQAETKPTQPENQPTEPESKPTQPENKPTEPETKPTQPENKPTEPESKPTQPENKPTEPETKPTQPKNKPTEPETKPAQPENKPTEPAAKPTQTENKPTQPESKPTQPENKPTQPESQPTQPENQPNQPENTPAQPENAPTQPENAPVQPESATAEPMPLTPELAEAIEEVVEAQAEALNEIRNAEDYALPAVELDETIIERDSFSDDLDRLSHLRDRNWNAFREEGEKDLSLGNSKSISGIYRDAIEAYFRVISRNSETKSKSP